MHTISKSSTKYDTSDLVSITTSTALTQLFASLQRPMIPAPPPSTVSYSMNPTTSGALSSLRAAPRHCSRRFKLAHVLAVLITPMVCTLLRAPLYVAMSQRKGWVGYLFYPYVIHTFLLSSYRFKLTMELCRTEFPTTPC